jgi:hypothetical protein
MAGFVITEDTMKPPEGYSTGLVERNYEVSPVGYNSKPFAIPLIPESEWPERLAKQKADRARLSDFRARGKFGGVMPSTDQGSRGYCWSHSTVSAMMLTRARQNEPYVELSAYAIACIIKNYRDQGGWGSESLEWVAQFGCPSSEFWPIKSVSRTNDTAAMRTNAAKHKVTEWQDHEPRNKAQLVTCLLLGIPVVSDFNWWGHSVCTMDLISLNPFRTLIWNSWSDAWNDNGTGILEGSKAIPDGAISPLVAFGG